MAIFQANRFVPDARRQGLVSFAATQSFAPDAARAKNGNVKYFFAPDQAVVPVTVAEVLICIPLIGLGRIITAAGSRR